MELVSFVLAAAAGGASGWIGWHLTDWLLVRFSDSAVD